MKARTAAIILSLSIFLGLWWSVAQGPLRDPKAALQEFYTCQDGAEDELMDPLILAGRRVVPLVIAELPNKEMPRRRYAIGFLGNGGYLDALPVLERILADETENDEMRADAITSIYQISLEKAQKLAPGRVTNEGMLADTAQTIVAGRSPVYWTRTYWQAFWHEHE